MKIYFLGTFSSNPNLQYNINPDTNDQIMASIDAQLRQRPQPPPISLSQQTHAMYPMSSGSSAGMPDAMAEQTALRVRRWIESRSVSDVREFRPILNAEIHQGFALRKTNALMNDRSAPRF